MNQDGVRVLVSLTSDVLVEQGADHESGFKTWNIKNTTNTAELESVLEVNDIADTSFTLTAEGSASNGVAKYEFYINGTKEYEIETTEERVSWNVTGKTPGVTYSCQARVYDVAGNARSSNAVVLTTIDNVAPEKAIISYSHLEATTLTLRATGSDAGLGIEKYVFYIYDESGLQVDTKIVTTEEETAKWYVKGLTSEIAYTAKVVVYDKVGNSTTSDIISFTLIDDVAPTISAFTYSNLGATSATLNVTASDVGTSVAKYIFYIYEREKEDYEFSDIASVTETILTTETSVSWDVTGLTNDTVYKATVIVYDTAGNSVEDYRFFHTIDVPDVGDWVDYSVTVDGVTYDKWRILHLDTNGHVEIVCYNGPSYTLGMETNVTENLSSCYKSRYDYANCIQILNNESQDYINSAKYGVSARHLGSNPTSPNDYASINLNYVIYDEEYYNQGSDHPYYRYLHQGDWGDTAAIREFAVAPYLNDTSWLARRHCNSWDAEWVAFNVVTIGPNGKVGDNFFFGRRQKRNSIRILYVVIAMLLHLLFL